MSSADHERAQAIVRLHGRDAMSVQALGDGYTYFFDGDDAVVPYVDVAGARVAAGTPAAPPERIEAVTAAFARMARHERRHPIVFATRTTPPGMLGTRIGEEPFWTPSAWDATLRATPSLREQLRRARAKGVTVRRLTSEEHGDARATCEALIARWHATRGMAEMAFVARVDAFGTAARRGERRLHVVERAGELVGLAVVAEVVAAGALSVEALVRDPAAPNGTVELLFDDVIRAASAERRRAVTLGLAPLGGDIPGALRVARALGRGFYDFEGLRAFKAKLRPDRWEPRYLLREASTSTVTAFRAVLAAFAGGSLVDFGVRTLLG